jgi:hypothetical protein
MMILHEDARRNDECLRARESFRSGFMRTHWFAWQTCLGRKVNSAASAARDRSGSDDQRRVVR